MKQITYNGIYFSVHDTALIFIPIHENECCYTSKTPSDTVEGVFKYYFFSMITNKTPVRIRMAPIQNVTPMFSPRISHPSNVPTTG